MESASRQNDRMEQYRHLLDTPWFYHLGFAAGRTIPKSVLYRVADLVGDASRVGYPHKDRIVQENLRRVLPDAAPGELAALSRRVFRNFTRALVDFGRFRSMTKKAILSEIRFFEGEENMKAALTAGTGVIVASGHIGNWELGSFFFGRNDARINVVTVPEGRPVIDKIKEDYRRDHSVHTIFTDLSPFASIEMMAALRRKEIVAMLVDRWGPEGGIRTGFFKGSCYIPKGPLALSRASGAIVLPCFVVRDGAAYRAVIEEPFVVDGGGDDLYARRLATALERVVSRYPDQWYNFVPLAQ
jgi:KDO2-lipid IV(A) lauroyltransferase